MCKKCIERDDGVKITVTMPVSYFKALVAAGGVQSILMEHDFDSDRLEKEADIPALMGMEKYCNDAGEERLRRAAIIVMQEVRTKNGKVSPEEAMLEMLEHGLTVDEDGGMR